MLKQLQHKFIKTIPKELEEFTLYISIEYATAIHKCFCGCGQEVVTPINPSEWILIFDGDTISLHPSIGNWSLPCKSHYWIKQNNIHWAAKWTKEQIAAGRDRDLKLRQNYYGDIGFNSNQETKETVDTPQGLLGVLKRFVNWFFTG